MQLLDGMVKEGEGNISWFPERMRIMSELIVHFKPQYIVEIGFNLGHSMKLIIDTLNSLENYDGIKKIYVFDICEETNNSVGGNHSYVKPNFEIMKNYYSNIDIQLIEGDSINTVKQFLENIDHEIDFIEVDGFHEGQHPYLDVNNSIFKLKKGGVIYLDDNNSNYPAIQYAINNTDWSDFNLYNENDIFYAVRKFEVALCDDCI